MATKAEITALWKALLAAYPYYTKDLTSRQLAEQCELWTLLLADVPIAELGIAAHAHIASNRFFPALAEIRQAALGLHLPLRESAIEAWGSVLDLMRPGTYWPGKYAEVIDGKLVHGDQPPVFANPITDAVVRSLGGFEALQISTERGDEVSNRARFIEAYNALATRERDDMLALPEVREARQIGTGQVDGLVRGLARKLTSGMREEAG